MDAVKVNYIRCMDGSYFTTYLPTYLTLPNSTLMMGAPATGYLDLRGERKKKGNVESIRNLTPSDDNRQAGRQSIPIPKAS